MTIAVYPGSFDPITHGHVDIVTRASRLFDKIVMAVVKNPGKDALASLEERVTMAETCVASLKNVEVTSFEGLTVDLAKSHNASVIIRGLRAVSDFENEFKMSQMNQMLAPDIETVFMMADRDYQFLTSSMVKEVFALGADVSGVVPDNVRQYLKSHVQQKGLNA